MQEYWNFHNEQIKKLKNIYNKINNQTKNRLQEIFKVLEINSNNLYNIASKKTKNMINEKIEEWKNKKLLKGYFGFLANNIYNRTRVKNNEILELLIYSAYIEEQEKLNSYENKIIYDDLNYYYRLGQEEVNNTLSRNKKRQIIDLTDMLFLSLLSMPTSTEYEFEKYKQNIVKINSDNLYKQVVIDIQQNKELDIDNIEIQNILKRQLNSKININGDKISGAIDLQLIELNNNSKLEGIKRIDEDAKVKFIAVEDESTTKMCDSLNEQIFNVHDWNTFYRYSKTNDRITKYKCFGLVSGLNLPPIDDGFHWCRSTVTYVNQMEFKERLFKKTIMSYNISGISKIAFLENLKNSARVIKDFPILENKIGRIVITKNQSYLMSIKPKIEDFTLYINSSALYSKKNAEYIYNEMVNIGDAPKRSTYKDILTHELGHAVVYEYIKRKYKSNYEKCTNDWNNDITAKEIIDKAYNGINIKFNKNNTLAKISNYALEDPNEAIAEAFVDYYVNKSNSQLISQKIVAILKEGL